MDDSIHPLAPLLSWWTNQNGSRVFIIVNKDQHPEDLDKSRAWFLETGQAEPFILTKAEIRDWVRRGNLVRLVNESKAVDRGSGRRA